VLHGSTGVEGGDLGLAGTDIACSNSRLTSMVGVADQRWGCTHEAGREGASMEEEGQRRGQLWSAVLPAHQTREAQRSSHGALVAVCQGIERRYVVGGEEEGCGG
jgi:hypothetical protein